MNNIYLTLKDKITKKSEFIWMTFIWHLTIKLLKKWTAWLIWKWNEIWRAQMKVLKPKELKWEKSQTLMTYLKFFFFLKKKKKGFYFYFYFYGSKI